MLPAHNMDTHLSFITPPGSVLDSEVILLWRPVVVLQYCNTVLILMTHTGTDICHSQYKFELKRHKQLSLETHQSCLEKGRLLYEI